MSEDIERTPLAHKQDAMTMACDLVRQFVNIAVGGIAFVVGLSVTSNISAYLFWLILIVLGSSVGVGLFFLMHGIGRVWHCDYNVYASSMRFLAVLQILLVSLGILLLCFSFSP